MRPSIRELHAIGENREMSVVDERRGQAQFSRVSWTTSVVDDERRGQAQFSKASWTAAVFNERRGQAHVSLTSIEGRIIFTESIAARHKFRAPKLW